MDISRRGDGASRDQSVRRVGSHKNHVSCVARDVVGCDVRWHHHIEREGQLPAVRRPFVAEVLPVEGEVELSLVEIATRYVVGDLHD